MNQNLEIQLKDLASEILQDYNKDRDIDKINTFDQPDRDTIIEIIKNLQKIIFPGYFKNKAYKVYTTQSNLSMLLEDVLYNLTQQISVVLKYDSEYKSADESLLQTKAMELALAFEKKIPLIREYIDTDVQAAFDGDPAAFNKDEIIFSYPGLYAITKPISH